MILKVVSLTLDFGELSEKGFVSFQKTELALHQYPRYSVNASTSYKLY